MKLISIIFQEKVIYPGLRSLRKLYWTSVQCYLYGYDKVRNLLLTLEWEKPARVLSTSLYICSASGTGRPTQRRGGSPGLAARVEAAAAAAWGLCLRTSRAEGRLGGASKPTIESATVDNARTLRSLDKGDDRNSRLGLRLIAVPSILSGLKEGINEALGAFDAPNHPCVHQPLDDHGLCSNFLEIIFTTVDTHSPFSARHYAHDLCTIFVRDELDKCDASFRDGAFLNKFNGAHHECVAVNVRISYEGESVDN